MRFQTAIAALLLVFANSAFSQDARPEPSQNPDARFRLFSTTNVYTFLKLDTRDGRIWQVQWGKDDYRFTEPLSTRSLATPGKPGRFTLYPTKNIYTFMLLDQETGEAWHVQWGKAEDRFVTFVRDAGKE